ncbi:ADP-ribosylation factor [Entamoeba marina]
MNNFHYGLFSKNKDAKILIVGWDVAVKTAILYKSKIGENVQTIPTLVFNVLLIIKNIHFTIWDIGGQTLLRPLYRRYYEGIYEIDFEAKEVLKGLVGDDTM